jgi:hypothetical protein
MWYWKLCAIRDWFLQIWFCHHNARVLADMEWRMACVLTSCTDCMSKPYYTIEAMQSEIADYHTNLMDEAVADYKKDHDCHCDEVE